MVFSSTVFLFLFLPIVLLIYYNPFIKNGTFRNVVLFFASIGFYAWGEPVFVFLMLFSILLTYIWGLWIEKAKTKRGKKLVTGFGVAYHVLILFIFKYLTFLAGQFFPIFRGGGAERLLNCPADWDILLYFSDDIVFV